MTFITKADTADMSLMDGAQLDALIPPGPVYKPTFKSKDDEKTEACSVHPQQRDRVNARRVERAYRELLRPSMPRQKYLHESRHRHAVNRVRGAQGRFVKQETDESVGGKAKKKKARGERQEERLEEDVHIPEEEDDNDEMDISAFLDITSETDCASSSSFPVLPSVPTMPFTPRDDMMLPPGY